MTEPSPSEHPEEEVFSDRDQAVLDGDLTSLNDAIRLRTTLEFTRIVLASIEDEEPEEPEED